MKKIISILISICMCLPFFAAHTMAEESATGGTYAVHTTKTGAVWNGTDTIWRYYDALYAWGSDTNNTLSNKGQERWIGNFERHDYATIFRFKLPAFADNEIIESAKVITTVSSAVNVNDALDVHAYVDFLSTGFGSRMNLAGVNFSDITANNAGQITVPATVEQGDKIEIDVTDYMKNLPYSTSTVDFALAVPGLNDVANAVVVYGGNADLENVRPLLKITTKEGFTPVKIRSDDADNAPVNGYTAEIQFDRAMDEKTLTAENITVSPGNIPVNRINYSQDKTTFKLGFGSNLLYNTQYTISFGTEVTSATGISVAEGTVFKFTTSASEDAAMLPEIITSYPGRGEDRVSAVECITLNFNKEVYVPDIIEDKFNITYGDGTPCNINIASVVVHPQRKSVFIYLDKKVSYNKCYTLSVRNIRDLSGNIFNDSISFKTAKASVVISDIEEVINDSSKAETTYTVYNTADGKALSGVSSASDKFYDEGYQWSGENAAISVGHNDGTKSSYVRYSVGYNSSQNWAAVMRFPMPEISAGEIITEAKLTATVRNNYLTSGETLTVNAYTDFTDIAFGQKIQTLGITFSELVQSKNIGAVSITANTSAAEIDVTDFIKSLGADAQSADIALAAPNASNYVNFYAASAGNESVPKLVIKTETAAIEQGSFNVTLENTTEETKTVAIAGALFGGDTIKNCTLIKDISVAAKKETVVNIPAFSERGTGDVVKVFGFESISTLVPLLNVTMGEVDSQFYPGYTRKAVTLSYDDGPRAEDITMMQTLNEKGLKMTLNIITDRSMSAAQQAQFDSLLTTGGHEASNHGKTHDKGNLYDDEMTSIAAEIGGGKNELEYKYNREVRGLAYPYGTPSRADNYDEITAYVESLGTAYARGADSTFSFDIPDDFMNWDFTCEHAYLYKEGYAVADEFFNLLEDDGTLKVLGVWGHGWQFNASVDDSGNEISPEKWTTIFNPFADTLEAEVNAGRVWNPTNIEFVDYINSVRGLVVKGNSIYNPGRADVYIKIDGEKAVVPAGGTIYR